MQAENVHTSTLNAVEALYLHPDLIAAIAERQSAVIGCDPRELEQASITEAVGALVVVRDRLCARAIEVAVRNEVKKQLPSWKTLLDGDPEPITVKSGGLLELERTAFDAAVEAKDFLKLLARYKVRETGATSAVAKELRFPKVSDYRAAVRKLLEEDTGMRKKMRSLVPDLAAVWEN